MTRVPLDAIDRGSKVSDPDAWPSGVALPHVEPASGERSWRTLSSFQSRTLSTFPEAAVASVSRKKLSLPATDRLPGVDHAAAAAGPDAASAAVSARATTPVAARPTRRIEPSDR